MIYQGIAEISDVAVAAQMEYKIDYNTQSTEDSGRDLAGLMHNVFLPFKWKLFCKWPIQTVAVRAIIMSAIYGAANPSKLKIKFLNPRTGTETTAYFMVGTPGSQGLLNTYDTESGYWDELVVNFIEV